MDRTNSNVPILFALSVIHNLPALNYLINLSPHQLHRLMVQQTRHQSAILELLSLEVPVLCAVLHRRREEAVVRMALRVAVLDGQLESSLGFHAVSTRHGQ